ncbi:MAG: hypothetical protein ACI835_000187 [Planctomycetota bacterium]|jgi:hypothetical protein
MNDLGFHLLLFLFSGGIIVVMASLFNAPDDKEAFRTLPKRMAYFVMGCSLVAGIMLVLEHTLAAVG